MHIPGLFILGTDTGVGKTYVTALLIREYLQMGFRVGAYKPACSGAEIDVTASEPEQFRWPDVDVLSTALGRPDLAERVCPQRFRAAAAPPVAARLEGRTVNRRLLDEGLEYWKTQSDCLLIEGIGGLLCPATENETIADLAAIWHFPLLIVARAGLGTINHTLLTVEAAQQRSLNVAGILLNEVVPSSAESLDRHNPREIALRTDVPVWGVLPFGAKTWHLSDPLNTNIDLRSIMIRHTRVL